MGHSVLVEEPEGAIQPFAAPPLPPEALALASPRQLAPNLLLHPVSNLREAPTRVAHRKVIDPAAQDRIDLLDQVPDGLRAIAPENQLELAQQGRPFLAFRRTQRHPSSPSTADPTELKAEKSETLSLLKIHPSALQPEDSRVAPVLRAVLSLSAVSADAATGSTSGSKICPGCQALPNA